MKNLDLKKAANDVAFETAEQSATVFDALVAAKGGQLQLTDLQYASFKQSSALFRQQYLQAVAQDAQAAKNAKPTPAATAAPAAAIAPAKANPVAQ